MVEGKLGAIWTLDRLCEYSCNFCCVDAYNVTRSGDRLKITSTRFQHTEPYSPAKGKTVFQEAHQILKNHGLALSLEQKLRILEHLKGVEMEIGFSGGDLLLVKENLQVVQAAAAEFGRENIGLAATGLGMRLGGIKDYLPFIGQLEFTYDSVIGWDENHRQKGYQHSNLKAFGRIADLCKAKGVVTQALIPISNTNKMPEVVEELYRTLCQAGVDKVYLMRTFPVGRGFHAQTHPLGADEYRGVIKHYQRLAQEISGPNIGVMCALRGLFPEDSHPCTLLRSTLDITATGGLIIDAFAYGPQGEPLLPEIVFGDLKETHIRDLIAQDHVQKLAERVDENRGHCKVFAYLNNRSAGINGFFSRTDPLYAEKT